MGAWTLHCALRWRWPVSYPQLQYFKTASANAWPSLSATAGGAAVVVNSTLSAAHAQRISCAIGSACCAVEPAASGTGTRDCNRRALTNTPVTKIETTDGGLVKVTAGNPLAGVSSTQREYNAAIVLLDADDVELIVAAIKSKRHPV